MTTTVKRSQIPPDWRTTRIHTKYAPVEKTWRAWAYIDGKYRRAYGNTQETAARFLANHVNGLLIEEE